MRTENTTGNYKFCNRDDSELERGNIQPTANTCFEVGELRVTHRYVEVNLYLQSVVHKVLNIA